MIKRLLEWGDHENIVKILREGSFDTGFNFIDMELCDINLRDYIHRDGDQITLARSLESLAPVFIKRKGSLWSEKMQNMWTIGIHIVRGLEFLHSHKQVHRDLKPANGMIF